MDLRAEAIVLSVPAVDPQRYYSVMLCDGNTYNYGYIGTRATGSEAGDYLVVGPDWKGTPPPGINKVFRSSTQFSLAGYRTQLPVFSANNPPVHVLGKEPQSLAGALPRGDAQGRSGC
jgi:hypothetical protein